MAALIRLCGRQGNIMSFGRDQQKEHAFNFNCRIFTLNQIQVIINVNQLIYQVITESNIDA